MDLFCCFCLEVNKKIATDLIATFQNRYRSKKRNRSVWSGAPVLSVLLAVVCTRFLLSSSCRNASMLALNLLTIIPIFIYASKLTPKGLFFSQQWKMPCQWRNWHARNVLSASEHTHTHILSFRNLLSCLSKFVKSTVYEFPQCDSQLNTSFWVVFVVSVQVNSR